MPNVVLDISPDGAKLQSDLQLLGQVDRFRLSVQGMAPVDCMPVWQRDGRVGVRFVGGPAPTMAMLDDMVGSPVADCLKRFAARYALSGVGLSAGGAIWNVAVVRHVIEKLPTAATSAIRCSNPMVFSAAA